MKISYKLCASLVAMMVTVFSCSFPLYAKTQNLEESQESLKFDKNSAFIKDLEKRTFLWFWENGNPRNGLIPDRAPALPSFASIASVGFGLTSYGIGVERHYITREDAAERTLTTLRFLYHLPQNNQKEQSSGYHGFFYHFLDEDTGMRLNDQTELSSIDTALLLGGILFAQSYYDRNTAQEKEIRALAEALYCRVDWVWMQNGGQWLRMGWFPSSGFIKAEWKGYNEALLLYLLALGAPTHSLPPVVWNQWTKTYQAQWQQFYGHQLLNFAPLFGHQYSEAWIDFRNLQDDFGREHHIDYFHNGREAAYAQRDYAIKNPQYWSDYGKNFWGLTACDGPGDSLQKDAKGRVRHFMAYSARGVGGDYIQDDGTIAPTAAGGSIAFAPEIALPALKYMKKHYGNHIYNQYGFVDAFNPSYVKNGHYWADRQQIGIDQGPILLMVENWRSGFVWRIMKKNLHLRTALKKAGFKEQFSQKTP